jgi:hypothetical protein
MRESLASPNHGRTSGPAVRHDFGFFVNNVSDAIKSQELEASGSQLP